MKIYDVKKVSQTTSIDEVNSMLANGWNLLKVDSIMIDDQKDIIYILGWIHQETEEEYKENQKSMPF